MTEEECFFFKLIKLNYIDSSTFATSFFLLFYVE
jgi:hypothetical protein